MTVIVIITPLEVWADDDNQWNDLRAWIPVSENKIPVFILKDASIDENHIDIVKNVIYSEKTNSERTLFFGWNEAIKEISKITQKKIPTLHVQDTVTSNHAITIHLTDKTDQKHDGYAQPLYDQNGRIQKMTVTIYNADELSNERLEIILRHELGHALGLGHTTLQNDLMNQEINMNFGLISYHDLQGLADAY